MVICYTIVEMVARGESIHKTGENTIIYMFCGALMARIESVQGGQDAPPTLFGVQGSG